MFIDVDKKTDIVNKGGSKFYGSPDVSADFEWPYIIDDEEEVDLEFVCQLNCVELSEKCDIIPQKGMLYFFIDPLSEKWDPENADAARVVYADVNTNELDYIDSIDQNGTSIGVHELKILFETNVLGNTKKMMEIMSTSDNFISLIKLNSDILAYCGLELSEGSFLEIFSEKNKIINGDFSDVRVKVVE